MKTNWSVEPIFTIGLHEKDEALLELIQNFLAVGNVYKRKSQLIQYSVRSVKDLKAIKEHFEKYPY
jgi:hypothetical protein